MPYNSGKEFNNWKKKKEKEEKILRENSFPEDKITDLWNYDYIDYKKDRNFHLHENVTKDAFFINQESIHNKVVESLTDVLDEIDNEILYELINSTNTINKKIIDMRLQGYSVGEIARSLNMERNAVYKRIHKLRNKLKKLG